MQLDDQSQKSLHKMFAVECSPLQDAELAASAIYWAQELDGPMKAAAARIRSAHKAVFAPGFLQRTTDKDRDTFVQELRVLVLARHGGYWDYLARAFDSVSGLEREVQGYLTDLTGALLPSLLQMHVRGFHPMPPDSADLKPWAMALSLYGRQWLNLLARGLPPQELMRSLWHAPPMLKEPDRVLPQAYVATEGSLHAGLTNLDALEAMVRNMGELMTEGNLYRVTYGSGERHPTFVGRFVGCSHDMMTGYPEPALRWVVANPALPDIASNGTSKNPLALWPLDIERMAPAKKGDLERPLDYQLELGASRPVPRSGPPR